MSNNTGEMAKEFENPSAHWEARTWESQKITPVGGGVAIEIPLRPKTPEQLAKDALFVNEVLNEVGNVMSRYMDPKGVGSLLLDPKNLRSDEKLAETLAEIEDNFPKIDMSTDQGIAEAAENVVARVEVAKAETSRVDNKNLLDEFKNKVLGDISKLLSGNVNKARRNFFRVASASALALVMQACAPSVVGQPVILDATSRVTSTPTKTAPPEVTPTPTETATPEPTTTPEVKTYEHCKINEFYKCEIPQADIRDGSYLRWLGTLSQPFDQTKIKNVPFTLYRESAFQADAIIYDPSTAPNFTDPSTAPFRRNVTSGIVWYDDAGRKSFAIVKPVEFFDKNDPTNNKWVIILESYYYKKINPTKDVDPSSDQYVRWGIDTWLHKMNITPILTTYRTPRTGTYDPLAQETFESILDITERITKFTNGDVSALSAPGIILLTGEVDSSEGTYR